MPKKELKPKTKSQAKPMVKKVVTLKKISKPEPKVLSKNEPLRTSPKDVFLHLLMLVMLYLGVISLISLSFVYVNYSFPDPISFYYGSGLLNDVRWQSSMLIVSFPLLILLSHFIQKDFRNHPEKHHLRFYKWLTYLTLFVSAITIVIDLIQLVNYFYGGELTTAFVLKVISVLIVAGAVFGYYIWEVQNESYKSKLPTKVAWATGFVVLAMLVLGFVLAGSPSHQREVRMDEQRVNDLMSIQSELTNYWQNKRELPENLEKLQNDLGYFRAPQDPESKANYEYKVLEPLKFELCATFNQPMEENLNKYPNYSYSYAPYPSENWEHEGGRFCFTRTIDPDLYPPLNPTPVTETVATPE